MTSRPLLIASLAAVLSCAAALAACSRAIPAQSMTVTGDRRLPAGTTAQLTASASVAHGIVHDVTASATWTSSDPSIATVSGGLVKGVGPGVVTIGAATSGVSARLEVTITDAKLVSIDVGPPVAVPTGVDKQFSAIGSFTDGTTRDLTTSVTWMSSAPSVIISNTSGSNGIVKAVAPGSAAITATDEASGIAGTTVMTVSSAQLVSLAITPNAPSLPMGATQQLNVTGTYTDGTTQDVTATSTWSSSSVNVATVSTTGAAAGLVSTTGTGTTTITATDPATGISSSTSVTVTAARLASIAVTPAMPSLPLGLTRQFTATGTYTDGATHDLTASVSWESSVAATATVSSASPSAGLATALGVGSTVVKATDAATGISGSTTLTVTAAQLVSISVTPALPSAPVGRPVQFVATGTYTNASTQDLTAAVTWDSSSASVASVSNAAATKGLATTLAIGTTTVTAADPTSGISGSTALAVTAARLVSIAVTPAAPAVPSGLDVQFTAIGTYTDASTQVLTAAVTWSSSTPAVAAISNATGSQGVCTAGIIGATTITATDPTTNISGSAMLAVTAAQLVSIAITPSPASVPLGLTNQFVATGTYTNGSSQDLTSVVTWSSSAGAVATISNAATSRGIATTGSAGATTITATDPATNLSGSTQLTVTAAQLVSVTVTPATASLAAGHTQQFTATGVYTDSTTHDLTTAVTWSSSATDLATISNAAGSNGLATAAASVTAASTTSVAATMPATSPQMTGTAVLTVTP